MTFLIVDVATLKVVATYEADAPNLAWGGPWGDANLTMHVALPAGMVASLVSVDAEGNVTQDPAAYTAYQTAQTIAMVQGKVAAAINFGQTLLIQFSAGNVMLGITQDGKTAAVMEVLSDVIDCLQTGSLVQAIAVCKAIPTGSYDSKYVTAARLLAAVNQIETYLNLPLSTDLS